MPTFTYTARDAKGELKTATIDAANREDVVQQLRRLRMNVVKVEEQSKAKQKTGGVGHDARHRDLHAPVLDDDQLGPAAGAGARHPRASRARTRRCRTSPGRWCSTSSPATRWPTRCAKHPKAFTDLYVNMVAAGEAGGILDTILHAPRDVHGKERRAGAQGEGRHDLPGRHHERGGDRDQRAAHLRHPGVPEHVRVGEPDAAAADAHRDRALGLPEGLLVAIVIGGGRRRCLRLQAVLRHAERPARGRPLDAARAGARRRAAQVGRVALHAHAGHADHLRRVASSTGWRSRRRPPATASSRTRSWRAARRSPAATRSAAPLAEVERLPADGDLDDRRRRADRRPRRNAREDRRLLRRRSRRRRERACCRCWSRS